MKRCPQCQRAYADETLRFCLDDGVPLSASDAPEVTQLLPPSHRGNIQTEVLPAYRAGPQPARPRPFPGYLYVLASLLAVSMFLLVAGAGVFAWLKFRGTNAPGSNRRVREAEQKRTPTPSPTPSPYADPLTRLLIGSWTWNGFKETFSGDGTGTLIYESQTCFNFRYKVIGVVLHMTVVGEQRCGPSGLDYRISIEGDNMRQEYTGNGYVSDWKRVR